MQSLSAQIIPLDSVESARAAGLKYVTGDGPGISRRRAGKGFWYLGVDRKPIRDNATLNRIHSLVIPPAWENVWICPSENGHIQAVGRDARGRKQYRYHPRYRQVRDETKFGRMLAFGEALPKIRKRVQQDLSLPGLPQAKVLAAIVRLLDATVVRIGNDEYAKANNSFGLTTLRDQHVKIEGPVLRLRFRGKSHQEHDIQLHDRRLAKIVKQCQDLPGEELFQYQSDSGEYVKVDSGDVNDYLREITGEDFTAKDFRTWHGTGYMVERLVAAGPAKSETEAKRILAEAVKETARKLGNRPAACRNYYIHPVIFTSYLDRTIFRALNKAQSATLANALGETEAAALSLIAEYSEPKPRRLKKAS